MELLGHRDLRIRLEAQLELKRRMSFPTRIMMTVKQADVKSRDRGLSAMPEEAGNILSKQDLRNKFLATLKPD